MSRFSSTPQPWKALAIGALLVCCVLGSHVAAAADSNTSVPSAVEPETAKFLQALVAGIPELREHITGDNYCTDWDFLACEDDVVKGVLLDSWSLKRPASLPELPEDLDGSKVTVERFLMNSHRSNLIGTLPSTWGKLTKMQNFQLIGNNLEGTLPAEWSEMTGLAQIRMSRNNLTGTLPEQWSRLKVLTVIVSRNHLTGTLPASWSALSPL
ncbi:surface membrane protein gp46-like protein, partial [Leptomonas pyrrhocoris]